MCVGGGGKASFCGQDQASVLALHFPVSVPPCQCSVALCVMRDVDQSTCTRPCPGQLRGCPRRCWWRVQRAQRPVLRRTCESGFLSRPTFLCCSLNHSLVWSRPAQCCFALGTLFKDTTSALSLSCAVCAVRDVCFCPPLWAGVVAGTCLATASLKS